jgi:hypothetical protein
MKHYRKMKRRQRARLGLMGRKRDNGATAWGCRSKERRHRGEERRRRRQLG